MNDKILMGKTQKLGIVWTDSLRDELGLGDAVAKDEIIASPESFHDTEYIFSTWGMPAFTKEEISACLPALKAVFYAAGSVQSFAREFIESGVAVFSAWAANAVPVAEFVVSQIILANKGYFGGERLFRSTQDKKAAARYCSSYYGNYRATVGIIGCGMIGSMVAEKLAAQNCNILVYDPYLSDEKAVALGVMRVGLEELFSRSDTVTNHVANLPSTVGLLTGELFSLMKPHAVFINTGRGAQVREDELISVLTKRPDLTALLDVTRPEPPVAGSPFYSLPNVFLTPHIAGSLSGECVRMAEYMRDEYLRLRRGEATRWSVTLKMLETMA